MGFVIRGGAEALRNSALEQTTWERGEELKNALLFQLNELHSKDIWTDWDIEALLLKVKERELERMRKRPGQPEETGGLVKFNPSSASKCERELFYRAVKVKQDEMTMYPYQRRWTRNSSAVHEAVQRDLLYSEKYTSGAFTVERTAEGFPAWEDEILTTKKMEHQGVPFLIHGKMDGILRYKDGSRIGFEYKTKSTTIAQIGSYKMKSAEESHVLQTVAYSLLFGIDEFLILYESVAKDGWKKGEEARPDLRCFYIRVTDGQKQALLDKWAGVASMCYDAEIPEGDRSKCIFCPFKSRCAGVVQHGA